MTRLEPKSARPATTLLPCSTSAASEVNTADMPVAVAEQAGAPSSSRSRSSNVATVGFA